MDPLLSALRRLASAVSKDLVGPLPDSGSFKPPPTSDLYVSFRAGWNWYILDHHPLKARVQELLSNDGEISQLFTQGSETWLSCPLGDVRIHAETLLHGLFEAAAFEILALAWPGGATALPDRVEDGLRRLRSIAAGRPVRVHSIAGFGGITVPARTDITLPWGALRTTQGHVGPTALASSRPATVGISTETALTFEVRHEPPGKRRQLQREQIWVAKTRFPLSVLLSSTLSGRVPYFAWRLHLLPCTWWPSVEAGSATSLAQKSPAQLTGRQVRQIATAASLVEERYAGSLNIAVERILAAMADRTDDSDRLIDALIAWESLVGTGQEVTYRVTSALATLLTRRVDDRLALQRKLRSVYGLRSRLVHGDPVAASSLRSGSELALEVATGALKALMIRRPDLIPMTSERRADSLILGRRR